MSRSGTDHVPEGLVIHSRPVAAGLAAPNHQSWIQEFDNQTGGSQMRAGLSRLSRRLRVLRHPGDRGMSTAEYAVGTLAACGFAAVLYKVVTSGPVVQAMQGLIQRALGGAF